MKDDDVREFKDTFAPPTFAEAVLAGFRERSLTALT